MYRAGVRVIGKINRKIIQTVLTTKLEQLSSSVVRGNYMHTRPHVLLAYRFPWKGKHCFLYGLYMYGSYVLLDGVEIWVGHHLEKSCSVHTGE